MLYSLWSNRSRSMIQSARQASPAGPLIVCLLIACLQQQQPTAEALELSTKSDNSPTQKQQQQHQNSNDRESSGLRNSLESELDNIVQQHESFDLSDRSLAEAIISRLMVDDLANELSTTEPFEAEELAGGGPSDAVNSATASAEQAQQQQPQTYFGRTYSGPADAMRLKKLLSMVQAYESALRGGGGGGGDSSSGFGYGVGSVTALPLLPGGQAATSKRAAARLAGSYQQHQANSGGGGGGAAAYGARPMYDFGLGKRPDSTGASSNLLRLGDSLSGGGGGGIQAANQFGKRPSAHRYDFGLGKRVASSAYPRYDFGLGKRAPNRIRYDFGLGKK